MGKGLCCPSLSCQQRAGEAGPAGPPFRAGRESQGPQPSNQVGRAFSMEGPG